MNDVCKFVSFCILYNFKASYKIKFKYSRDYFNLGMCTRLSKKHTRRSMERYLFEGVWVELTSSWPPACVGEVPKSTLGAECDPRGSPRISGDEFREVISCAQVAEIWPIHTESNVHS